MSDYDSKFFSIYTAAIAGQCAAKLTDPKKCVATAHAIATEAMDQLKRDSIATLAEEKAA